MKLTGDRVRTGRDLEEPVQLRCFPLAFEDPRRQGFCVDRLADQAVRSFSEQDLTGLGRLLHSGAEIHRVPDGDVAPWDRPERSVVPGF